nr:unnamed protein product [Digitaria exilis]
MAPPVKLVVAFVFAAVVVVFPVGSSAELPRLEHPPTKADGSLTVLAVGDWGRRGQFNQSMVAEQMGIIGKKMDIDFVVNVGDNFYKNGLTGVDDKAFEESFTNIYTAESLQKPWYTNFFFIDTTPFVLKYWNEPKNDTYDWRGVAPREAYIANVLKDLNAALKQSKATWKIVIGHHAIRSVSNHGDTQELVQQLLPILKANGVDMYINGHDHCLEHISSRDSSIQYLTSGGGSKAWRGSFTPNTDKLEFFYDGQGFMSLQLTKTEAHLAFYDVAGTVLHSWGLTKGTYY